MRRAKLRKHLNLEITFITATMKNHKNCLVPRLRIPLPFCLHGDIINSKGYLIADCSRFQTNLPRPQMKAALSAVVSTVEW